ncbi:ribosome biogenesis GTPase Der [Campylobacter sp. FMV-PI01]|uniref:GTPase Der n=1 Tax=Campylobacter portucalensis TaxID=2608384 RepID=A0A6L5WIV2_9BACT|nr:ribosome biogenesis GTPase Der [Campylobacter portucalensis]MSN96187.1 ribosome biogenesis GTPase Der [Campylobacter portucalensis]
MQKIIIIGRPNVGKSSLFNRLARQRIAITSDISGTTRDTNKTQIEIYDKNCILVDSGGLDDTSELFRNVQKKSLDEAKSADVIIFMVDGKMMPDEIDRKIAYSLLSLKKPLCLAINKIDSQKDEMRSLEFKEFGIKNMISISVSHNTGINDLKDFIYPHLKSEILPDSGEYFEDFLENFDENSNIINEIDETNFQKKNINVGIIGRVNVGKSSLLNALVKDNRSVVSSVAGTTIDPVNESFFYEGRVFEFVDTAGIRKRSKIEGIEKFALNRTQKVLENSDIALLVLDANEGFNELDERIAGLASKFELGVIIVLNKWENRAEKDFDEICKDLRDRFKFLSYAPIISISALQGKRVNKIYPLILEIYQNFTQKLKTSHLNEVIKQATINHPIPSQKGKVVKIYYAAQFGFAPPKIALIMNRPKALHFSYKRYLINSIRKEFNLTGVPVMLIARKRGENEEEK